MIGSRVRPSPSDVLLTAILGLVLFLTGLSNHDLWNPDEARYGEVAREMMVERSPMIPLLNGELYAQKPPLHFWSIIAASSFAGEVSEWSARLPTALAAVGSGILVLLMGFALYGPAAGRLAAAMFLTSGGILWQGRTAQIDMTLTFFILLGVYGWLRGWLDGKAWGMPLFFAAAGFGTLAKGLPALVPPLLSILVFHLARRHWSVLRRLSWLKGSLIYLVIVGAWLGGATLVAGLDYPHTLIFDQTLKRYVTASEHLRPWYYYAIPMFFQSLPFTPLFVASWLALRNRDNVDALERDRLLWPLFWMAVTVLFFSLSSGKRTVYVIAMAAPMALVLAAGLTRADLSLRPQRRAWIIGLAVPAVLFGLVPVALLTQAYRVPEIELFGPGFLSLAVAISLIPVAGIVAAIVLAIKRRPGSSIWSLVAGFAVVTVPFALFVVPRFDVVKSARPLAEKIVQSVPIDEPYAIYPVPDAGFMFYTKRYSTKVRDEEALREYVDGPGTRWLVIERDVLEELDPPLDLKEVARDGDWVYGHVLLRTAGD